jgi:hypothetical protein
MFSARFEILNEKNTSPDIIPFNKFFYSNNYELRQR